jgi:glycosyltransferase involved in cell wall biosynthesis
MQKSTFQITVLIPINDTKYLFKTLASIEAQTFPKSQFKVLLVADRVTVESIERIARDFSFPYEVVSAPSAGIVAALNMGISRIDTEYIARMDADDLMLPNRLQIQIQEFERSDELVGIGGGMILFRNEDHELRRVYFPKSGLIINKLLLYKNLFSHPTMMLKTSAVRQVGMYRNTKSEDWDLWNRLIEIGEMTNLKVPLIKYRLHPHQISITNPTVEPEVSVLIQFSKWMRKRGFRDFPDTEETPNDWISGLQSRTIFHRKVQVLLRQQERRISAQKVLAGPRVNNRSHKLGKLCRAMRESPLEVFLTFIQRLFKYF